MNHLNSYNQVVIVGRLGADAEVRQFTSSTAVTFSVATDSYSKGEEGKLVTRTAWHSVIWFGSIAEKLAGRLTKGAAVCVEGRLSYKKDAKGSNYVNIVAEDVTILSLASKLESKAVSKQDTSDFEPEVTEDIPF